MIHFLSSRFLAALMLLLAAVPAAALPTESFAGFGGLKAGFRTPANPLRVVGTNSRPGSDILTPAAANTAWNYRSKHSIGGGPVTELRLLFSNWYSAGNAVTGEVYNANPLAYQKASVEIGGKVVPVTFSGQRAFTVPGAALVMSDPIPAAAFGLTVLPQDTLLYIKAKGTITAGASIYTGTSVVTAGATAGGAFYAYDPTKSDIDSVDAPGALTAQTSQALNIKAPGPVILGRFRDTGVLAVVAVGDSIADGAGDASAPPAVDGQGYMSRATVDGGGANTIAMLHLTRFNDFLQGWNGNRTLRSQYFRYANVALEELGTNDFSGAALDTTNAARLNAMFVSLWADLRRAGIERIVRNNYLPKTGGAWTNADGSDQVSNAGYNTNTSTQEASFSTALTAGQVDYLLDERVLVNNPSGARLWNAPSYTADGTHPAATGHAAIAPLVRSTLLGIAVKN